MSLILDKGKFQKEKEKVFFEEDIAKIFIRIYDRSTHRYQYTHNNLWLEQKEKFIM